MRVYAERYVAEALGRSQGPLNHQFSPTPRIVRQSPRTDHGSSIPTPSRLISKVTQPHQKDTKKTRPQTSSHAYSYYLRADPRRSRDSKRPSLRSGLSERVMHSFAAWSRNMKTMVASELAHPHS
jgi:hypothetical protein